MPVAAAAILQRIADFLAIGAAPQVSTEAGDGFSVLLARNAAAPAAKQTDATGKSLPLDRQDLAGEPIESPTTEFLVSTERTPNDETAPASVATDDMLPSTIAMLIATDPLPKALATIATPETQGAPAQEIEGAPKARTEAPVTQATAPVIQPAVAPRAELMLASPSTETPVAADSPIAAQPIAATAKSAKSPKQTPIATTAAHAQAAAKADSAVASTPAPIQPSATFPASKMIPLPQTVDPAEPTETALAAPVPAVTPLAPAPTPTIELPASTVVVAASPDAADRGTPADIASPAQPAGTRPQLAHRDHHIGRSLPRERQAIRGETMTQTADAPPAVVGTTLASPPVATIATDVPASPDAIASQPSVLPTPSAPTLVAAAAAPLPRTITPEQIAAEVRPAAQPARQVETAAVAGSQPTAAQPAAIATAILPTAVLPAASVDTNAEPAPATAAVSLVARSTRPAASRTPTQLPVETPAPAAKAEVAAPVVPDAVTAPETLPFRTTARQILAAQPAPTDASRTAEIETTVRTPAVETAPTIAQHLAPVGHSGERIIATALPTPATALSTEQAAALVETIQLLRSEAKSDAMTLAVEHDELGKITMRFDRTDHGVAVRIDSPDPAVNQLIANSAPALRASGDGVGMRFERQDAAGSGAGSSRDAPRQGAGQDRNPTPYAQSSRPRASGQRDGLFA